MTSGTPRVKPRCRKLDRILMSILPCPRCGQLLHVGEDLADQTQLCNHCGAPVPAPPASTALGEMAGFSFPTLPPGPSESLVRDATSVPFSDVPTRPGMGGNDQASPFNPAGKLTPDLWNLLA